MSYRDLRAFVADLEKRDLLRRLNMPVSPALEMTEICDRTLRAAGPAILFTQPVGYDMPVLGNLFGTTERVALGMGGNRLLTSGRSGNYWPISRNLTRPAACATSGRNCPPCVKSSTWRRRP